MKFKVPDKTRYLIAKKLLDTAEALPSFNGGPIQLFQVIRKHQRDDANKTYEKSRLPDGCQIRFSCFRLIEFFPVEDLDQLIDSLVRLFPSITASETQGDSLLALRHQSKQLSSLRWLPVGSITKGPKLYYGGIRREMSNLPEEVDHIHIDLCQLLPSIFVAAIDVHLSKQAQEQLQQLYETYYLPEVKFTKLIPLSGNYYGHSSEMARETMRREIENWSSDLHTKVEKFIGRHVSGYFLKQPNTSSPKLPSIEVSSIKGLSEDGHTLIKTWARQRPEWLHTRGLSFGQYDALSDGQILLRLAQDRAKVHKLIVLEHSYQQNHKSEGEITDHGFVQITNYIVNELMNSIALDDFLDLSQQTIEDLRLKSFRTVKRNWASRFLLTPYINLNDSILQTSMLLDRISAEFSDMKPLFLRSHWIDVELKWVKDLDAEEKQSAREIFATRIESRIKLLNRHLSLVKDWLSQHLALRNTISMYWLSLIVGLATIISVIGISTLQQNLQAFISIFVALVQMAITQLR